MAGSINRRILRVDLSDGKIWTEEPGDDFYRKHPGGRAIIAHYLLTEVPAETDPLGPDNRLIFACGPMTGVQLPGNARHSVGARSPLTGFYGEGEAGGFWNAELKSAGWDAIVVQGAAENPVYLWIEDLKVEIRDAEHLWGKVTGDVQEAIQAELGEDVRVAQTGIAGENLVKIACVCNDLNEFAGRTGLGAVMGSKKLKAIAVRGSNRIMPVDIGPIRETTRWVPTTFDEGQEHFIWHEWGTGARVREKQIGGHVISHNFRDGMLAAWLLMLGTGLPTVLRRLLLVSLIVFVIPTIFVPILYLMPGPASLDTVLRITWFGVVVPTGIAWAIVGLMVARTRRVTLILIPLVVSLLLYSVGVLAAILGLEGDTRVTAHYHGTVGAVTVAFMGLSYHMLPGLGVRLRLPKSAAFQPLLYGLGLFLLIAALFWASNYGGQRKAFEAFAKVPGVFGPTGLFGLGAALAMAGGAAYVLSLGVSVAGRSRDAVPPRRAHPAFGA